MRTGRSDGDLMAALAVVGILVLAACAPPPPSNVVLIVVDTLRADHLGLYGYPRETSPAIDAWGRRAAVFDRAVSTSPWTLPSFGSIFTGRLPAEHGAGRHVRGTGSGRTALSDTVPTLAEALRAHGMQTAAIVGNPFLRPRFGIARGFDSYDYQAQRTAGEIVGRALSWIDDQGEKPYFLFLHFMDPHLPYRPPEGARGRFTAEPHPPMPTLKKIRQGIGDMTGADRQLYQDLYDEEIAYLDDSLGALFQAFEGDLREGRLLVLLTADHGEEFFDHGGFEHGHTMFQELLRVPLLIRGPQIAAGHRDDPVSVVDLMPTILEAVGYEKGGGRSVTDLEPESLDGLSLWPLLQRGRGLGDRRLLAEGMLYGKPRQALIDWPLKLVYRPRTGSRSLFDLSRDPGELHDLAADRPQATERLLAILEERRASLTEPTGREVPLDASTRDELEALGYLQ